MLDCLNGLNGWLIDDLNKIIVDGHNFERFMAQRRQRQAARELGQNRKSIEGLGRPRLEIDSYAHAYWGQRLGYQCWKDPQFLREFERDNEHCRVKATGTKLQIGYGSLCSGATRKVVKKYS